MPYVNVTTTSQKLIEVPAGAAGIVLDNESDADVRYQLNGAKVATSGADLGPRLKSGDVLALMFGNVLTNTLAISLIHGSSGNKVVSYAIIPSK